jgi:hypothetical protein
MGSSSLMRPARPDPNFTPASPVDGRGHRTRDTLAAPTRASPVPAFKTRESERRLHRWISVAPGTRTAGRSGTHGLVHAGATISRNQAASRTRLRRGPREASYWAPQAVAARPCRRDTGSPGQIGREQRRITLLPKRAPQREGYGSCEHSRVVGKQRLGVRYDFVGVATGTACGSIHELCVLSTPRPI